MMASHVVRDLSFAVSFASEDLAIEQHNRLGSFLSGRLMAVVDEVFSQLSPGDGSLARIEDLDVDLGEFQIASYYEDVETRLRERLEDALRLKLSGLGRASIGLDAAGARAVSANGGPSEGIVSASQNELDLFVHFIETGYLPWNIQTLRRTMLDDLLGRILANQGPQLADRLRAASDKQSAAYRLASQFSEDSLAGIADNLDSSWKGLVKEFRGYDERPDWAPLLLVLLNGRSGPASQRDWTILRRSVEQAIHTGNADPMRPFWAEMLADNRGLLADVVRELGVSVEARRRMARGFSESMLVAIAGVLEPREIDFIEASARGVDSLRVIAKVGESQSHFRAWFWEFTLTSILAASGGRFTRKTYLEGVCSEMAGRWSVDYEMAVHALAAEIASTAGTRDLSRAASSSITGTDATSSESTANGASQQAEQWAELVDRSLAVGDAQQIAAIWPMMVSDHRELLFRILRLRGGDANFRRVMAHKLPLPMLREIVRLIEPSDSEVIEGICGSAEWLERGVLQAGGSRTSLERSLWEFAFTYLFAERGNRFDRRLFVSSLVRQIAARTGLNDRELVERLTGGLKSSAQAEPLRAELMDILSDFGELEALSDLADREEGGRVPWTLQLEAALASGDPRSIVAVWGSWMRDRRAGIARVFRRFGLDADGVHSLAQKFPLPMLRDIAEALEPSESQFIEYLSEKPALFRGEAAGDAANDPVETRLLWEFTLNYLLVERGGAFNRRSYLASLAHGMAAHHNLRYEDLVESMIVTLEESPRPSALEANLLSILGELRGGFATKAAAAETSSPDDDLKADRGSASDQNSLHLGAGSDLQRETGMDATGLLAEFKRCFLSSEWVPGIEGEQLLADALRRFALEAGTSPEGIRRSLLAELASTPAVDGRLRQSLQELRGESSQVSSRSETKTLTVAEVIRSCELYDFLASRISGDENRVWASPDEEATASDLHLMLEELQRDYPWQLRRLIREMRSREMRIREAQATQALAGEAVETLGEPRDGFIPDEELREVAQTLLPSRGARNRPALESPLHSAPLSNGEVEESLLKLKSSETLKSSVHPGISRPADVARLIKTLETLLAEPQEWFRGLLRRAIADDSHLDRLIEMLPERQLARILFLSAGPGWHRLLAMSDMIVAAVLSGEDAARADSLRGLKWRLLFQLAKSNGHLTGDQGPHISEVAALREVLRLLDSQWKCRSGIDLRSVVVRELRLETSPSGAESRRRILEALAPAKPRSTPPVPARRRPPPRNGDEPKRPAESTAETDDNHIYILNAGQVLAAPYMPRLFEMTGLVIDDRFLDADASERGVHLLQYMVDQSTGTPEHLLPLNKILCGLEPDTPIAREVDLLQTEKDAAEGLLEAMIAHWTALGKTSPGGLRESFLQREGRLRFAKGAWQLLVQPRAFDMLIDRLPWGFKVIKHSWMNAVLYVEWR